MAWTTLRATGLGSEDGLSLVDLEQVRQAAAVLFDSTSGVQIQALPLARWITCKGGDLEGCAQAARRLAAGNRGVYWTLNPCPPDLAEPMKSSVAIRRRWLLLDADPERPAESNSTEAEHEAARLVLAGVQDYLIGLGWPLPVIVDSGNGWHLLFRVDLPNDDASRVLLRETIKLLANTFDTEMVHLDRKVHDARRISKLPGTLTRKGPGTPERPHRFARLVFVPEKVEVVPAAKLKELEGKVEAPGQVQGVHPDIWKMSAGADRKRAYFRNVLEREIARVVLAPVGQRNDTLNRAAFSLGTLIGAGAGLRQEAEDGLFHGARRNGLDEGETRKTITSGIEAGLAKPRDLAFLDVPSNGTAAGNGKMTSPAEPKANRPAGIPKPVTYTMADLMGLQLPPPRWAVPGLLSEGLSFLAGKPKLGKSWLALNLALTIAVGGKALGSIETVAGDVLYLSLEDRLRRVQDRARKVLGGLKVQANGRLTIAVEWLRQDKGGLWQLMDWLEAADNPRLVIIDVWARFRTPSVGRRSAYDEDYEAVCEVKRVVDQAGSSLMLVHHCKKGKAEDVIEEISGTLGLGGSADGNLVLVRTRGENEATLHITGRDVNENQLALTFEPTTCCWTSDGDARLKTSSKIKEKIINVFRAQPHAQFWPNQLAEILGIDRDSVKRTCYRMADDGLLKRIGAGKYSWPVDEVAFE